MKLIDADSMRDKIQGDNKDGLAGTLREWIDAQPTVDAIPVEWLREKSQTPCMTCDNPFDYVLTAWEEASE